MSDEQTFCKVPITIGDQTKNFFIVGYWQQVGFRLELTDGRCVWTGEASAETVKRDMCPHEGNLVAFLRMVRESLAAPTAGQAGRFSYSLKVRGEEELLLEWRIRLEEGEDLSMVLSLTFRQLKTAQQKERLQELLTWLMVREHTSNAKVASQKLRFDDMEADLGRALQSVKRLTEEKERMELALYEKFVLVLNSKKEKILEMKNRLERATAELASVKANVSVKTEPADGTAKRARVATQRDDDNDDDNEDNNDDAFRPDVKPALSSLNMAEALSPTKTSTTRKRVRQVAAAPARAPALEAPEAVTARARPRRAANNNATVVATGSSAAAGFASPASVDKTRKGSRGTRGSSQASSEVADPLQLIAGFE